MNKVLRKDNLVFGMSREILNWGIMEDEIGGVSSAYNIYKLNQQLVSPTYLRLYMRARLFDFNSLIGTAAREGQSLDKGQLMQKQVYIPSENFLQDFFDIYHPIMEAKQNLENEETNLVHLRDTLLPRLMSGELKVSETNQ
jgi:type I restriction enzyme S subunit